MRLAKKLLILFVALACGCATGPEFAEIQSEIPSIETGQGRVFIYRPQLSFLYVGSVSLNGEEVRVPPAGGFVFVDRTPGEYEVVVDSVTVESATFQLEADEEKFIRITVDAGGYFLYTISPQLTERETALEQLQELNYIGPSKNEK